jgi:hypothetical protein
MKKYLLVFTFFLGLMGHSQDTTAVDASVAKPATNRIGEDWTIGTELDLLPYISGGYYVSLWYGKDHLRYRGVYARTNVPSFAVPDGFSNHELWAAAFIVDYFFKENFEGWWVAAGYEYWDSQIQTESGSHKLFYNNNIMTVGGGYVWKFADNFYLNPWAAGHILITGTGPFQMGDQTYTPSLFTPELSLKVGWHF